MTNMAEQWHAEMTSVEMRKAMAATRPPNDLPEPRARNGAWLGWIIIGAVALWLALAAYIIGSI